MKKTSASLPLMGSVKYREDIDFREVLNQSLHIFFKDALRVALNNPSQALHFLRTIGWQRTASRRRRELGRQGIHVPPMMILSITNRCNLHCKGCYNWALRPSIPSEMDAAKLRSVVAEGADLRISFMMIAGGEPLVRPEILDITGSFPETTFLLFTNGLLITEQVAERMASQRNVVPVISLEGRAEDTDGRRGHGVYQRLQGTVEKLKKRGIFWSVSLTVTRTNFTTLTDEQFIKDLVEQGCRLFFFVEYTPVSEDTEE